MLDNQYKIQIQQLSDDIREAMNDCNNLDYDFTDWCEGGSLLMWYYIDKIYNLPKEQNYVAIGTFKGKGHLWNVINGTIIDTTVDQFCKVNTGIISTRTTKHYNQTATMLSKEDDVIELMHEEIDYLGIR